MRFKYCPECGQKAILKEIGDEGLMPYCADCKRPLFDMFSTCVICAAVNELNEIALIRQSYVTNANYVCVAGYIKSGENAEQTAAREVFEELGLSATGVRYISSWFYDKKDMLMLGYRVDVKKDELDLSGEVDSASWFAFSEAEGALREGSIARALVSRIVSEG